MDNIQFGDVKESQPAAELRPDENAQFSTRIVGQLSDQALPIFVDLDVMRDMEAHSVSNTRVELGGVMLGRQFVGNDGKPFVLVSESLRAEHYFATKGSFTFTHDTWSEITRRRSEFHPDLQMVGWYHTHPGWNVFLSGMDLFICENFFSRPLDVALVIDPVNDDRGWFQWESLDENKGGGKRTVHTGGFVLMTGRHRKAELECFAKLYEKNYMSNDPRYSGQTGGHTVQLVESRRQDMALISMLAMQLIFMATIVYFYVAAGNAVPKEQNSIGQREAIRHQAQAELLAIVVAGQTGDADLADEFSKLKEQEFLLRKNLEGQLAVAENQSLRRKQAEERLQSASVVKEQYANDLVKLKQKLAETKSKLATVSAGREVYLQGDGDAFGWGWGWWLAAAIGLLATGVAAGYVWKSAESPLRRRVAGMDAGQSFKKFDAGADERVDQEDSVVPTRVG